MPIDLTAWPGPDRGALFVVTGASGVGKTTLVRRALDALPGLRFSVSATTRPPRPGERDGIDYHFVDDATFDRMVAAGELLEWARVYDHRYGTPREPVEAALRAGRSIVLDVDHQGARQVRAAMPEAVGIFILPPSFEAMADRLRARSTDPEEVIERRLARARAHLEACGEFDYLLVNDVLSSAHDRFQAILVAELHRRARNPSLVRRFGGAPPAPSPGA